MLAYLDTLIGFTIVMLLISLLITILTQIVSALVNHRGSNLRWGLKTLFENIDPAKFPQLTANAKTISNEVLRHCLISDSSFSDNKVAQWFAARIPGLKKLFERFKLASAIRPKELADILGQFGVYLPGAVQNLPLTAQAQLMAEINALLAADSHSAGRDMTMAIDAASAAVAAIPPQAGTPLLQESVNAMRTAAGNLEAWFGSMMDRVAQRFAMYMRLWTVVFAVVFAFGTGLNSISLMSELYSNGAFRNALAGAGQQVTASATTVLDAQNTLPAVLTTALKQAIQDANATPAVQPPEIKTTAEGAQWIQASVPAEQRAAVLDRFNANSSAASQKLIQDGAQAATKLIDIASKAGFDVLKFRWPAKPNFGYFCGVVATAVLLTLGAPFWFNALKSMTNLRPILASKEKSEQG